MNSQEIIANIRQICQRFPVPPNLQKHLFCVASIGNLIADNWKGPAINRTDLVAYLLLHDLGNLAKFDFSRPQGDLDITYWKKKQEELIAQHGKDEHEILKAFAGQLDVPPRVMHLLMHNEFTLLNEIAAGTDWEQKIGKYADMRVAPWGIASLGERFTDLKKRYAGRAAVVDGPELMMIMDSASAVEKQIFAHTALKPEDITDASIKKYVDSF